MAVERQTSVTIGYPFPARDVIAAYRKVNPEDMLEETLDEEEYLFHEYIARDLRCNIHATDDDGDVWVFYPHDTITSTRYHQLLDDDSVNTAFLPIPNNRTVKALEKLGERIRKYFKGTKLARKTKPAVVLGIGYF